MSTTSNLRPIAEVDNSSGSYRFYDIDTFKLFQTMQMQSSAEINKYLIIDNYPDSFYDNLQLEINRCYSSGAYAAQCVMHRKIIENLLIDIFRKGFGDNRKFARELYFNISQRRFQTYFVLLNNFIRFKMRFIGILPNINQIINNLKLYKEIGDISAHNIVLDIDDNLIHSIKNDFENTIKSLLRLYIHIPPYIHIKKSLVIMSDEALSNYYSFFARE